jgi:hypothetical protein
LPPHDDFRRLAIHSIEKKASWSNDQGADIFITLLNDIAQESMDCVVVGHGVSASPSLRKTYLSTPKSLPRVNLPPDTRILTKSEMRLPPPDLTAGLKEILQVIKRNRE